MAMADVTIYGAGIFGLSIAWSCVKRGARVQVIDPNGPGAGASGGIVGALAPHVPENWNAKKAFQFESLVMAEGFWAEVAQAGGQDAGYSRAGRLQPIADEAQLQLAQARAAGAAELWQGRAQWDVVAVGESHPFAPPSPSGWLIFDTLSGHLHPRRAIDALVAALQTMEVEIKTHGVRQGQVLYATGVADLTALSAAKGRLVGAGVKGQAALLEFDAGQAPQVFADALHFIPHRDGTLAVGSTTERDFEDPTAPDAALDDLIDRARRAMPALGAAPVIQRWAGLRPRSRSRAPMLGVHPLHQQAFIANGGFKIGFGMAPKVGEVMAQLMLENIDTIPSDFRPDASF